MISAQVHYAVEETFYGRGEPRTTVHAFSDAGERDEWVSRSPKRKKRSVEAPMPPKKVRRAAGFGSAEEAAAACSGGGGPIYHKGM